MATADNPTSTTKIEKIDPSFFIPQGTRDNYLQIARDAAAATGGSPKDAMGKLADDFEKRHEADPVAGWDHLAEWAKDADPGESTGPSALALAQAKAVESARRDPSTALQGDQAVVAEAVKALDARAATTGVGNDPSTGVVANPGPVPVENPDGPADPYPPDVTPPKK